MKLNPDCIRDILISAESVVTFNDPFYYDRENPPTSLQDYSHEEIIYHIRQAHDAALISISPFFDSGDSVYITDLTPYGHEFLANIRTETVWKKLRDKGIASIPILFQLAKDFSLAYYQGTLQ